MVLHTLINMKIGIKNLNPKKIKIINKNGNTILRLKMRVLREPLLGRSDQIDDA